MSEPSRPGSPGRKISNRRRHLFVMVLLVAILVFQEVAFRLVFPIPETTRFNRIRYQLLAETDPRFQPLMKRGLVYDKIRFESSPDGWSHLHNLNRFGFRERDFAITPSPGRKRLLVVGDSVTEGQGAAASQTIPAQLGTLLGNGYEVLNLGVVAATLDKVVQLSCDSTALLTPQTLVLVLNANDTVAPLDQYKTPSITELRVMLAKIVQDEADNKAESRLPRFLAVVQRLVNQGPVYSRFFTKTIRYFAPTPDSTNPFKPDSPPLPGLKPELENAMRAGQLNPWLIQQSELMPNMIRTDLTVRRSLELYLRVIQQMCQSLNVKFVLAYVPSHGTVHPRYAQPLMDLKMPESIARSLSTDPEYKMQAIQIKAMCDRLNIPFVDTTPALVAEEAKGQPQFWAYDSHPRPEGYSTIAKQIAGLIAP